MTNEKADELFAAWASRVEEGESSDFEELLRAHPDQAVALREMHRDWELFAPLLGRVLPGVMASGTPLKPLSGSGDGEFELPSQELIDRLGIHSPNIGRYRFRAVIGRGGGGVVLKVWDSKLKRALAMKVVLGRGENKPTGDTPRVDGRTLARFVDEARIASQLNHPGIVPVHELGADENGRAFFTMKLVRGENLSAIFKHVKSGQDGWNQTRALSVILKVCEAMAFAHDKGVIHRDLKPANIMVGRYGEVHVMDWGLARVLGEMDTRDIRIKPAPQQSDVHAVRAPGRGQKPDPELQTMDGAAVGTPSYMSPEQARGEVDTLGPTSDVYSIGAMLYELLVKQPPFIRDGARIDPYAILAQLIEGPPRPVTELAPRTPAELIAICQKAMQRNAADRYSSVLSLAADLRAYLELRVVSAYESGTWAETRKWIHRNTHLATAIASLLIVLLAGIVVSSIFASKASTKAAEAELAGNELSRQNIALVSARNEAVARARDGRLHGLMQDVEQFDGLDDDYAIARRQSRPAIEWWIDRAHQLVDGTRGAADGQGWSPGLSDVDAELDAVRARALPRIAQDIERDQATHSRAEELKAATARLGWLSRMLGKTPWDDPSVVSASITTDDLEGSVEELVERVRSRVQPDVPPSGDEVKSLLLAERAVSAAESAREASLESARSAANDVLLQARDAYSLALLRAGRIQEAREMAAQMNLAPARVLSCRDSSATRTSPSKWTVRLFDLTPKRQDDESAWADDAAISAPMELSSLASRKDGPVSIAALVGANMSLSFPDLKLDPLGVSADLSEVFPSGIWRLDTWSDDGLRVWIGSERVIDTWVRDNSTGRRSALWRSDGVSPTKIRVRFHAASARSDLTVSFASVESAVQQLLNEWTGKEALARQEARRATLEHECAVLRVQVGERRTWRFKNSSDEWWHLKLVQLRERLEALRTRLSSAESTVAGNEADAVWQDAIVAIQGSKRYMQTKWPGGGSLTRQLGLWPLGPDPESGLWEFAHIPSGQRAERAQNGKLNMTPACGVVFVLLPGGRVPEAEDRKGGQLRSLTQVELDPFFMSKYELTQEQWGRLGGHPQLTLHSDEAMFPMTQMTAAECVEVFHRHGWLLPPTEAQWEYACRAGTASRWSAGNDEVDLRGVANLRIAKDRRRDDVLPVGLLRANAFGLHDMHGNVPELCADYWQVPPADPRPGDGLKEAAVSDDSVVRGGDYSHGALLATSSERNANVLAFGSGGFGVRPARPVIP